MAVTHTNRPLWHVCLPDIHFPFHDETAFATALAAIRALRPRLHGVTQLGDAIDASAWSTHPRRSRVEAVAAHQVEIDALARGFADIARAAGKRAKLAWTEGNHEARVERELLRLGRPDLVDLLSPTTIVRRAGFAVAPYARSPQQHVIWRTKRGRRVIACHGAAEGTHATRNHARMACWRGDLVVHGHTHRRAHHVEIDRGVLLEALSPGCLARLDPAWCAPRPTAWDHGIVVLLLSDARIDAWTCPIARGAVVLPDGREVRA